MQALRHWSFARVLVVSGTWFILGLAAWLYFTFRVFWDVSEESGGIGAVSVGISLPWLAILLVPPIVLVVVWLIARRRKQV